ncbi:MAG: hypothetical protein JNK82_33865 [Myxococcaceae bacterium]|nr:hypothetical protein [Myxococcaceae bacterium]
MAAAGGGLHVFGMTSTQETYRARHGALKKLAGFGLSGIEVRLAELYPAVEMAWADGVLEAAEHDELNRHAEELTRLLNAELGAPLFTPRRARRVLGRMLSQRLDPRARAETLAAVTLLLGGGSYGALVLSRMMRRAVAVGAASGRLFQPAEALWLSKVRGAVAARDGEAQSAGAGVES